MIDVKEAVRVAMEYVQAMYTSEEISQLLLEEVELSGDESTWSVTVSFLRPVAKSPIEAMTGQHGAPIYKVLTLRADSGQVRSMKNCTV